MSALILVPLLPGGKLNQHFLVLKHPFIVKEHFSPHKVGQVWLIFNEEHKSQMTMGSRVVLSGMNQ